MRRRTFAPEMRTPSWFPGASHHDHISEAVEPASPARSTRVDRSDIRHWMNAEVREPFLNLVHAGAAAGRPIHGFVT